MAWYDSVSKKFIANVAVAYFQEKTFDPMAIFPAVKVNQKTGYIGTYDKADWLRIGDIDAYKTVGAVESVGDTYAKDKQTYLVDTFRFHEDVTQDEVEDADAPFSPVSDAVKAVIDRLERVLIANFVQKFMQTSLWSFDKVGTTDFTKWSSSSSTPIADVFDWKEEVLKITGFEPNRMAMTYDVYKTLRSNSNIKDQLKTTSDKVVTAEKLAQLFDLEELRIMRTIKTTAKKGASATSSNTGYVASNSVLLAYAPQVATKFAPSAGYHILRRQGGQNVTTKRIPMPELDDALRIEGKVQIDAKLVASDLGVLATSVV